MAQNSTLEYAVEDYLVKRVKALGGLALKSDKLPGQRFIDRTCILPGGRTVYVEVKRPSGGRRERHQIEIIERLQALGHEAYFVKTKEEVDELLR